LLTSSFSAVYPNDFVIGGTLTATFTSASALIFFLPSSGTAGILNGNLQNPTTTSAGELTGEVAALKLNVDMSNALGNAVTLGSLTICNFGSVLTLNGQTVTQFLAVANHVLGGGSGPTSPGVAAAVARLINIAFAGGTPSTFAQANLVA